MKELVKIVVFVPLSHTDILRKAMGEAGAGNMGNYAFASYSSRGIGRFLPLEGATPAIGEVGKMEEVEEERIEVACEKSQVKEIVAAIKKVHPYEEIAMDIYPVLTLEDE